MFSGESSSNEGVGEESTVWPTVRRISAIVLW